MAVSKAQQAAVHKYVKEKYDRMELTLPKGRKDELKSIAAANGESLNGFISRLVNDAIEEYYKQSVIGVKEVL